MTEDLEILQGAISAVVYQNYENGYAVLRVNVGSGQNVTVVGTIPMPAVGERLMVTGKWSTHSSYGRQFEAEFLERLMPQTSLEILNYLSQNYRTATLHDTAAHFGYSTSHFSTLIKEGTGRTFLTIIKELKLSQASRALRETSLSINSICELTGYENPEHFMRLFKKTYSITPGEYRKEHRGK